MAKKIKVTSTPAPEYVLDLNKLASMVASGKKEAKEAKVKIVPEAVDKGLHGLAVNMAKAESAHDKALNAVYTTFKLYVLAALPIIERMPAHIAALQDIRAVYGAARKPAAIQRVTMLNNIRTIAYGKPASRDTPAQAAQGVECVIEALNTCASLPALKQVLSGMKSVKHAAQGVAKGVAKVTKAGDKAKANTTTKAAPVKADDVLIPSTRNEAIKAACRMLKFISDTFLNAGTDSDLVLEVADVVEQLQRKAA
jgi:hypothetical protein